jgi:hypothetical protein
VPTLWIIEALDVVERVGLGLSIRLGDDRLNRLRSLIGLQHFERCPRPSPREIRLWRRDAPKMLAKNRLLSFFEGLPLVGDELIVPLVYPRAAQ